MDSTWNFSPQATISNPTDFLCKMAQATKNVEADQPQKSRLRNFKRITPESMPEIWKYLLMENGRTTDFSYGGILMWVDIFNYEYAIYNDTLFIKGVVESDLTKPAFSMPIGKMTLKESVELLLEYCMENCISLEFSAIPEYALQEFTELNPRVVEELKDWGDYLYDADMLAYLKGKKMGKKRNHVNQFECRNENWSAEKLTPDNAHLAMEFMDVFDLEGDSTETAVAERELSRKIIRQIENGDSHLEGMLLYVDGKVCAYTIGDIKGDTLFVHVEKATRTVNGSYEMINHLFAKAMKEQHPEIEYINREDDAGDIGLRMAKESYHPVEILKKYNIIF